MRAGAEGTVIPARARSITSVWGVRSVQHNTRAHYFASKPWFVCAHSIVQYQQTPLMYAAEHTKSLAIVELLLNAEADVNATEKVSARERYG